MNSSEEPGISGQEKAAAAPGGALAAAPGGTTVKKNIGVLGVLIKLVVNVLAGLLKITLNLLNNTCKFIKGTYLLYVLKPVCDMTIGQGNIMEVLLKELDKIPTDMAKPEDVDTGSTLGKIISGGWGQSDAFDHCF